MELELAASRVLNLRQRLRDYVDLTKPRIMILSLLTVLGAMSMAAQGNWQGAGVTAAVLAGVAMAVGAGGALNNFLERKADARMVRTAGRPLPSGRLHPWEALVFGTALWIASYFLLYFRVNPPTAFLTMLAFGTYVGLYTPLKRHTDLCTLVGAVPGALPPLIGWTAVRGQIEFSGFLLFAILLIWQIPHFLALALLRREEYREAGMPMLPVVRGEGETMEQILLYTAALIPLSLLPYGLLGAGRLYLVVAVAMGAGFLYLAFRGLVLGASPRWCKKFFFYSILYLAALFISLVIDL